MSDRDLWAAMLDRRVLDAIFPFVIPNKQRPSTSFDEQFKAISKKREAGRLIIDPLQSAETRRALIFFECSHFDEVVEMIGYDSEFVKRTFDMVQKFVTARKKIMSIPAGVCNGNA